MENYAKRLALEHGIQGKTSKRFYPIIELKKDFEIIRKAYDVLTESIDFTAERFEMPEKYTMMDGVL